MSPRQMTNPKPEKRSDGAVGVVIQPSAGGSLTEEPSDGSVAFTVLGGGQCFNVALPQIGMG